MDPREFVADPEQPDEGPTRWIHRPSDVPLQAPIHDGVPYHLPFSCGPFVPGDPPTSIDLHYVSHPASLFDQQSADLIENIHTQEAHLPEDVQLQLAEARLRYEAARYQIIEGTQAIPAISHVREATASYSYAPMGGIPTGYTEVNETPNMPICPSQISNHDFPPNDSGSTYGFDARLWSAQHLSQTIVPSGSFHPNAQGFGQHSITFANAQNLDYNAFNHSAYGQQPPINPTTFAALNHDAMTSVLSQPGQGSYPSSFLASSERPLSQQNHQLRNPEALPRTSTDLLTNTTIDTVYGATDFSQNLLWNGTIDPCANSPFSETMHVLPANSRTDRLATSIINIPDDNAPSIPTGAVRRQSRRDILRQDMLVSPYDRSTRSGREMEKIEIYEGPAAAAGRPSQGAHPTTYSKRGKRKNARACFGCRLKQKGVSIFFSNVSISMSLMYVKVRNVERWYLRSMS